MIPSLNYNSPPPLFDFKMKKYNLGVCMDVQVFRATLESMSRLSCRQIQPTCICLDQFSKILQHKVLQEGTNFILANEKWNSFGIHMDTHHLECIDSHTYLRVCFTSLFFAHKTCYFCYLILSCILNRQLWYFNKL